jgi:GH25 family lysozyme M1 (1,4-beta-N-acetylmuramidase)
LQPSKYGRRITSAVATTLACGALMAGTANATPVPGPGQAHAGVAAPHPSTAATAPAGIPGLDVSGWQENVDWDAVKAGGAKFAFIKATESTDYRSGEFDQQWSGSYRIGLLHAAYHYATPDSASGTAQADFFVDNGGGQTGDGRTLPGVLDIEDNVYGPDKCYGFTPAQMVSWIHDFINEYHARTGWWATINTFTEWWNDCTAGSTKFAAHDALWINNHGDSPGPLPAGWKNYFVWQWADTGVFPGDQDVMNPEALKRLLHPHH